MIPNFRLNNGDVSRKNAQSASCLKPSDFEKAFHIVQAAIGGSRARPGVDEIYGDLVEKYNPSIDRDRLLPWIRATERALLQSDTRLGAEDLNVKCAIFFWVCSITVSVSQSCAVGYALNLCCTE